MRRQADHRSGALEIRALCPELEQALGDFFSVLRQEGADEQFHPHPLTNEEARRLCAYTGDDLYYVLLESEQVLAYGMLRGWDEGYDVPSLGVATRSTARGAGLGTLLVRFLHAAARRRGARKVILKVYKDNSAARKLYERLGYSFSDRDTRELSGSIDL
jgi:ribosomal protein S18 acetylase RimI-like enzyme